MAAYRSDLRRLAPGLCVLLALAGTAALAEEDGKQGPAAPSAPAVPAPVAPPTSAPPTPPAIALPPTAPSASTPSVPAPTAAIEQPLGPLIVTPTGTSGDRRSYRVENVALSSAAITARALRIDLEGTNLSQSDVERLFNTADGEPLIERLRQAAVDRMTMPEVTTSQPLAGGKMRRTIMRDFAAENFASGRIGRLTVGSLTTSLEDGTNPGSFGAVEATDLDPGLFFDLTRATTAAPGGRLLGSLSIKDVAIRDANGETVDLASLKLGPIGARAPEGGYAAAFALATSDAEPMTPDGLRQRDAILKLIDAVDIGSIELAGLRTRTREGWESGLDRVAFLPNADGPDRDRFELTGLVADSADGRATIGEGSIAGIGVKRSAQAIVRVVFGPISQARDAIASLNQAEATARLGRITYESRDTSAPRDKIVQEPGREPDMTIASVDVTSRMGGNRSFSSVMNVDGLQIPVRPGVLDELKAFGYDRFAGSLKIANSYSATTREMKVDEMVLAAPGMGRVALSGLVSDLDQDAFSGDPALLPTALEKARFREAAVTVQDDGLIGRFLAATAKREKKPEAQLRRAYASQASLGAAMMLAGSPDGQKIGAAISQFVEKPGTLRVVARPGDANGLPLSTLFEGDDPQALLKRLRLEATRQ